MRRRTLSAVGEGVKEFKPGDLVVSDVLTEWLQAALKKWLCKTPGDGIDGYAEACDRSGHAFHSRTGAATLRPRRPTLTTAGLTAWRALVVEGGLKAGDVGLVKAAAAVSVFALQIAKAMGAVVMPPLPR